MDETEILFMRIREFFRKTPQTNWGKQQIIKLFDDMEETIKKEKQEEKQNEKTKN